MPVRCVVVEVVDGQVPEIEAAVFERAPIALVVAGPPLAPGALPPRTFQLPADVLGAGVRAPEVLAAAAGIARCFPRDLLVVAARGSGLLDAAGAVGARATVGTAADVLASIAKAEADEARRAGAVGVGPHPEPWPPDDRLDPDLLARGDRRNVVDRYRYWREEAIAADLAAHAHDVQVAVENWQHDLNIGTVVRNANAFGAAGVHIVGARRWNRRGAMATDRYLAVTHHPTVEGFAAWAQGEGLAIVGIDNVEGSVDLDRYDLPRRCVLVLGQEGPGLSDAMAETCDAVLAIAQFGSTRSINAGVASGIALHRWAQLHAARLAP